jgi:hypothetical protein
MLSSISTWQPRFRTVHAAPEGVVQEWFEWCIRRRAEGLFQPFCDRFQDLWFGLARVRRIDRPDPAAGVMFTCGVA